MSHDPLPERNSDRFTLLCKREINKINVWYIWHDDVANVTCYVYHTGSDVAMQCIPDHQLKEPHNSIQR